MKMQGLAELKPKAILLGWVVSLGGAPIVGLLSRAIAAMIFRLMDGSPEDFSAFFNSALPLLVVALLLGLALTVAGGVTTAFLLVRTRLLNVGAVGVLITGGLILTWYWLPLWYDLASLGLTLPSALVGSWGVQKFRNGQS